MKAKIRRLGRSRDQYLSRLLVIFCVGFLLAFPAASNAQIVATWFYGNRASEYSTTNGATIADPMFSGLDQPFGIAVSDGFIYVVNLGFNKLGFIGKYSLSGATVNASLISGLFGEPQSLAVADGFIYLVDQFSGTIGKYTTSGGTVNAAFLPNIGAIDVAVSGTNLYVTQSNGTVGKYTTAGATVNASLLLGSANFLAVSGNDLFVGSYAGQKNR